MKRVGIYSGTFDPIHDGHITFARQAIEQCGLDKVFFLVEPRPRRKQGVKAHEHRMQMVRLAIAKESKLGSINLGQDRFSVTHTMPLLHARFKGAALFMLMGDDVLMHLADWPHVDTLVSDTSFVVGVRKGHTEVIKKHLEVLQKNKGLSFHYNIFSAPLSSTSSSAIRRAVKAGRTPEALDPKVWRYIQAEGLYASGSTA